MPILEICVDTPFGVSVAAAAGADRIELCSALALGGLTPSSGLAVMAVATGVPVAAMIRPHEGGFRYDEQALAVMADDIERLAAIGVEGVVFGATDGAGALDRNVLERLMEQVGISGARRGKPLKTTLHRAIDLCVDPCAAVEQAIDLGFDRVLSAGGAVSAIEGSACLAAMHARAADRCQIIAGAGIDASNVGGLVAITGVRAVHASCRSPSSSTAPEDARASALGFGGTPAVTSAARIRALRHALDISYADQ